MCVREQQQKKTDFSSTDNLRKAHMRAKITKKKLSRVTKAKRRKKKKRTLTLIRKTGRRAEKRTRRRSSGVEWTLRRLCDRRVSETLVLLTSQKKKKKEREKKKRKRKRERRSTGIDGATKRATHNSNNSIYSCNCRDCIKKRKTNTTLSGCLHLLSPEEGKKKKEIKVFTYRLLTTGQKTPTHLSVLLPQISTVWPSTGPT